eukprot:3661814-Pleurochrysis_carterae.AAC.4
MHHFAENASRLRHEIARRAVLRQLALFQYHDLICVEHGIEPVSDGDDGGVGEGGANGPLYQRVGLCIDGRGGLVHNHERAARKQCACDAEKLALARREVGAVFSHLVVERAYGMRQVHALQRRPHRLRRVLAQRVEVVAHGSRKEHRLLRRRGRAELVGRLRSSRRGSPDNSSA